MHLAVFGDLHGSFMAAYDAVAHWEQHHGTTVDAVLLTGDQGLFHDPENVDGATVRHYRRDPTELCGVLYANGVLKPTQPTYFVRGNHEDFDHLLAHKGQPIDPDGPLVHLWADEPSRSRTVRPRAASRAWAASTAPLASASKQRARAGLGNAGSFASAADARRHSPSREMVFRSSSAVVGSGRAPCSTTA